MTDDQYDEFLREVEKTHNAAELSWIISTPERALAFQQWCADNGFEVPEVRLLPHPYPRPAAKGKR